MACKTLSFTTAQTEYASVQKHFYFMAIDCMAFQTKRKPKISLWILCGNRNVIRKEAATGGEPLRRLQGLLQFLLQFLLLSYCHIDIGVINMVV